MERSSNYVKQHVFRVKWNNVRGLKSYTSGLKYSTENSVSIKLGNLTINKDICSIIYNSLVFLFNAQIFWILK